MFSVFIVTAYLVIYCILLQFETAFEAAMWMFLFSPLTILWMVYSILVHGKYDGTGLNGKEFGYQDRPMDSDADQ